MTDAERWRGLAALRCVSLSLSRNDEHACNYVRAAEWIEQNPKDFAEVAPGELERMRATDTIWSLQIYPDTPVGFYMFYGATAEAVVDEALAQLVPSSSSAPAPD